MQDFIAVSQNSKELLNSATLLKELNVNVLIKGSIGCGKKSLAKYMLPNSKIFTAFDIEDEISKASYDFDNKEIIIKNIEEIKNVDKFISWLNDNNIKVVATTNVDISKKLDEMFHISLLIPDLKDRKEDLLQLSKKFSKEIMEIFEFSKEPKNIEFDLSSNAKSLRSSIYFAYLVENISKNEILYMLEKYFSNSLEKEDSTYKDLISIFEIPLLKASQKIYKNQLQMAQKLDITRVTLRKKLDYYKEYIND